jgi:hypothetical protein
MVTDRRPAIEIAIIVLEAFANAEDPTIEDATGYNWAEIRPVITELEEMYQEMDDTND